MAIGPHQWPGETQEGECTIVAKANYLERYLAGEYESVWAELQGIGAAVHEEPLYSVALAVARETMRCARRNIETLIPRLEAIGFRFGYDWLEEDELDFAEHQPPIFAPPGEDIQERIAELESLAGVLPLSLRAWYETVGAVNLVGMLPETWGNLELDPLQVFSIEDHIEMVRYELTSAGEVPDELVATDDAREKDEGFQTYNRLRQEGKRFLMIAPDHWFKYNISGSGSYEIAVPDPAADARLFLEWHHTTFVNYLRICFRWGGLPGLEHVSQVPAQDLATLTNDLLPL